MFGQTWSKNQDSTDPLVSSWVHSSAHASFYFPMEALLACPPFHPWNLPFFTVESTLSSPCSCFDPPPTRQGAALAHLDSLPPYDLVFWTDGSVPFPFDKGGSDVLTNCSLAMRPLFHFQQAQYAQVFPLKSASFCKIFAGLDSTNKSATSLLFLSDSRSVLFFIFLFTAISPADLVGTVFCILLFYQAIMGPRILVSPRERLG